VELSIAMLSFFALVVSWFALPAAPRAVRAEPATRPIEAMAKAA